MAVEALPLVCQAITLAQYAILRKRSFIIARPNNLVSCAQPRLQSQRSVCKPPPLSYTSPLFIFSHFRITELCEYVNIVPKGILSVSVSVSVCLWKL